MAVSGIFANRNRTLHDRPGRRSSGLQRVVSVHIFGIQPLMDALQLLPGAAQRRVMRTAVTKAATPILKAAKRLAPKGAGLKPGGAKRDHLRKTLAKVGPKIYTATGTLVMVIGPKKKQAPHSHLVHDGTKPHKIPLGKLLILDLHSKAQKKAAKKQDKQLLAKVLMPGFVIEHPGAKANPFLANAVNATRKTSFSIMRRTIASGLLKEAKKLAKKSIKKRLA